MTKRERAALHEAGHAVIARVLGICIAEVTIGHDAGVQPDWWEDRLPREQVAEAFAKFSLAGPAAQCRNRRRRGNRFAIVVVLLREGSNDYESAMIQVRCATGAWTDDPVKKAAADALFELWLDETEKLVDEHWPAIERVARALLVCPVLDQATVDEVIAGAPGIDIRIAERRKELLAELQALARERAVVPAPQRRARRARRA